MSNRTDAFFFEFINNILPIYYTSIFRISPPSPYDRPVEIFTVLLELFDICQRCPLPRGARRTVYVYDGYITTVVISNHGPHTHSEATTIPPCRAFQSLRKYVFSRQDTRRTRRRLRSSSDPWKRRGGPP